MSGPDEVGPGGLVGRRYVAEHGQHGLRFNQCLGGVATAFLQHPGAGNANGWRVRAAIGPIQGRKRRFDVTAPVQHERVKRNVPWRPRTHGEHLLGRCKSIRNAIERERSLRTHPKGLGNLFILGHQTAERVQRLARMPIKQSQGSFRDPRVRQAVRVLAELL